MYSSNNCNIKCLCLTIKDFELIHYAISLDVVSSSMIFSDFDSIYIYMLLSMYLLL